MEQRGTLPPIIEDEGNDSLFPAIFEKDVTVPGGTGSSSQNSASLKDFSSHSSNTDTNPTPSESYRSWKAKFSHPKPTLTNGSLDMQSKLGQSLESNQRMVHVQGLSSTINSQLYSSPQDSALSHRPVDPSISSQTLSNGSNFAGTGNFTSQQDVRLLNFAYDNSAGYFPDRNKTSYLEHTPIGITNPRNFPNEFSVQNKPKYHSFEKSFNHTDSSHPYGINSYKSFSPHHSPSSFNSHNSTGHPIYTGSQRDCCSNGYSYQIQHNQNNFPSPFINSEYSSDCLQVPPIAKPHHSKNPCSCKEKSEAKEKKREKIDKIRKKQINDLYRIVWLQNEQIIQIQNQFKKLIQLNQDKNDEKIRRMHDADYKSKVLHKGASEKRMFNLSVIEQNKNLLEKVSVGIMTSFIDTTKVTKKGKSTKAKKTPAEPLKASSSSSICSESSSLSSSDDDSDKIVKKQSKEGKKQSKLIEDSIALNAIEIPTVADHTPNSSPIQLELQDFESSSGTDQSDTSDSDEENPAPVGWTFYDKVVGKVNNMLVKSEAESDSDVEVNKKTVEQLRKLGVNFEPESPSLKRVTFDPPLQKAQFPDSDTSMKINALAMKYFKEGHSSPDNDQCRNMERHHNNGGNTNLSYATMHYLERYHLQKVAPESLKEKEKKKYKKKKEKFEREEKYKDRETPNRKHRSAHQSGKILDITAIKQQPKLLPKRQ